MFDTRKYAASIVWSVIGVIILIWQFVFPDPIPELIIKLIERDNSAFVGLDITLKIFLLLYTVSGMASLLIGIVTAFITHKRCD